MSPAKLLVPPTQAVRATLDRIWAELGTKVRETRLDRGWTIKRLAAASGSSRWSIYLLERGESTSLELVVRALTALGLRLEVDAIDPRRRMRATFRAEDPVHAFMGASEAAHLRGDGSQVGIDEPYQHFQFAGRADVAGWGVDPPALIHFENRTRFPNLQEMAGSWNAKRAYLANALGEQLGVRFRSVTHVLAVAWTAETLHAIRLHPETFRSLASDPPTAFATWWSGKARSSGTSSTLIVIDPLTQGRARQWIDLEAALTGAKPRYRGYAELAGAIRARAA